MRRILLLLLLATWPARADWGVYSSTEGRFAVNAPSQPKVTSHNNDTMIGDVAEHIYRWDQPGLEWVVNYSDVPDIATAAGGVPLYIQVRQGFKHTTGRPVTNEQSTQLYGYSGRTFDFTLPPQEGRPWRSGKARVFLAEHRLYVLTVTWDQRQLPADQTAADRFFGSFKVSATS